jgi:hypothetical protein
MKSIHALALLLLFAVPSMALSPVEQAYVDGVNDGVKIGQSMGSVEQYNIAAQQFNDKLNLTFPANASAMWLPLMPTNQTAATETTAAETASSTTFSSTKPVHKMDATPSEIVVVQA